MNEYANGCERKALDTQALWRDKEPKVITRWKIRAGRGKEYNIRWKKKGGHDLDEIEQKRIISMVAARRAVSVRQSISPVVESHRGMMSSVVVKDKWME